MKNSGCHFANSTTVLTIASRLSVTVMNQGTNLVSGKPAEVRANPLVLDAYLGGGDDDEDDDADKVAVNG